MESSRRNDGYPTFAARRYKRWWNNDMKMNIHFGIYFGKLRYLYCPHSSLPCTITTSTIYGHREALGHFFFQKPFPSSFLLRPSFSSIFSRFIHSCGLFFFFFFSLTRTLLVLVALLRTIWKQRLRSPGLLHIRGMQQQAVQMVLLLLVVVSLL